ncbi:MAG: hypothetical protein JWN00_2390 [Actinomycetia bacterium]|nr:hypothetical protein [Actinomycetes bacterium]
MRLLVRDQVSKSVSWKPGASAAFLPDSAPFPQLRAVLVTARAGRTVPGAAIDASAVGEQTLIARMVAQHPEIFTNRVFLVDRNFLGHALTTAILDVGEHLVMRVKKGIALPAAVGNLMGSVSHRSPPGQRMVGGTVGVDRWRVVTSGVAAAPRSGVSATPSCGPWTGSPPCTTPWR